MSNQDRELLELASLVRSAGLHHAISTRILAGGDVVLSTSELAAIVRAAAAIGQSMKEPTHER